MFLTSFLDFLLVFKKENRRLKFLISIDKSWFKKHKLNTTRVACSVFGPLSSPRLPPSAHYQLLRNVCVQHNPGPCFIDKYFLTIWHMTVIVTILVIFSGQKVSYNHETWHGLKNRMRSLSDEAKGHGKHFWTLSKSDQETPLRELQFDLRWFSNSYLPVM